MKAYVICCNDSIEKVVLSNKESAQKVLGSLSKKSYDRHKFDYATYKDYQKMFYWHLHKVEVIEEYVEEQISFAGILDAITPKGLPPLPKYVRIAEKVWRKYKRQPSAKANSDIIELGLQDRVDPEKMDHIEKGAKLDSEVILLALLVVTFVIGFTAIIFW